MAILKKTPDTAAAACRTSPVRWFAVFVGVLAATCFAVRALAADTAAEIQVKAALIYRFTTLTEWPENAFSSSNAPVCVGIIGPPELENSLRAVVEGKKIGTHSLVVVPEGKLADHATIHVLVVAESPKHRAAEHLAKVAHQAVLTIGDQPGFAAAGGMLRLRRDGPKLTFDVNIRALRRVEPAGLKLNPQVLKLGRIVEGGDDE